MYVYVYELVVQSVCLLLFGLSVCCSSTDHEAAQCGRTAHAQVIFSVCWRPHSKPQIIKNTWKSDCFCISASMTCSFNVIAGLQALKASLWFAMTFENVHENQKCIDQRVWSGNWWYFNIFEWLKCKLTELEIEHCTVDFISFNVKVAGKSVKYRSNNFFLTTHLIFY